MSRRRPSPALVVAIVALVVALTGTATAASVLVVRHSSQLANGVVTGQKIKKRTITADRFASGVLVRGPQGAQGAQGPAGPEGPAGPKGDAGAPGAPGTARAYADFRPDVADPNKLIAARSRGVTGYTHPATGVWCLTLSTPIPDDDNGEPTLPVLVSVDAGNSTAADPVARSRNSQAGCPQGTAEVRTFDGSTPADTVGFTALVP
jgi:hypothetical protein